MGFLCTVVKDRESVGQCIDVGCGCVSVFNFIAE